MSDPTTPTLPDPSAQATLDHLARLVSKRDSILAAIDETVSAWGAQLERTTPDLSVADMIDIWEFARRLGVTGLSTLTTQAMGTCPVELQRAREIGYSDSGTGTFPIGFVPWLPRKTVPCVYLLMSAEGECLYIGQSCDVKSRLRSHWRAKRMPLAQYEVIICESPEAAWALEGDLIFQHKPPYNKAGVKKRRVA